MCREECIQILDAIADAASKAHVRWAPIVAGTTLPEPRDGEPDVPGSIAFNEAVGGRSRTTIAPTTCVYGFAWCIECHAESIAPEHSEGNGVVSAECRRVFETARV
jgi:hypothetical protein